MSSNHRGGQWNPTESHIVPQTSRGYSTTITASVKNMSVANLLSLAHFPIAGIIEVADD